MTVQRALMAVAVFLLAVALPGFFMATAAGQGRSVTVPLPAFEFRYHGYEDSTALLKGLVAHAPQLAKLYSIGKSATGKRELWCIEIGNQQTGPAAEKPATYFDGSQHATEVIGGETALYLAHYLLANYGKDPAVTRLVDTRVTYILQRADPDGAEAYLTGKIDWPPALTPGAYDRDGDGAVGEDAPEDVDGDGEILTYRIPDPNGRWKKYAGDTRIMTRRLPEDREGPFYTVMDEGIDNDGDGQVNEDAPFDFNHTFVSNRNYPAYWASGDGRYRGDLEYPLQEHNTRLIVDFLVKHPNISQVESWHTTAGVHLRPYGARPDSFIPPQDLDDFSAVLAKGSEITGYPVISLYADFTTIRPGIPPDDQPGVRHGTFLDWAYGHRGLFATSTELLQLERFLNEVGWGDIPRDRPLYATPGSFNRPDVQAQLLKWLDANRGSKDLAGQGFVEWRAITHPTLGAIEVGGFTRHFLRNPPPGRYFQEIVMDQATYAVMKALTTPLARIQAVKVRRAGIVWEVSARILNEGYLDTSTEQARLIRLAKPVDLRLELPSGARTTDPLKVTYPFLRGMRGTPFEYPHDVTWRVEAPAGTSVTIVLESEQAGTDRRAMTLTDSVPGPSSRLPAGEVR